MWIFLSTLKRFEHLLIANIPASPFSMEAFSNVQFLTLCEDKWNLPLDLPTFHNLIHLEIVALTHMNWAIVNCLQSFPKLQSLVIKNFGVDDVCGERFMEVEAHEVPPCISSYLKELAVVNFRGSEHEFKLVRFIMENASVLRTVIIARRLFLSSSGNEDVEMLKTLSSYARISAKCRLFFERTGEKSHEALKKYLTIRKSSVAPSY